MGRAAGTDAAGGRHRAPGALPRRPAAGAVEARAHLEYRGAHRVPGPGGRGWAADPAVLRRVRDALAGDAVIPGRGGPGTGRAER
jgi:hypothetical protein